ncbi:MAG TPA: YwiC-like family protein [Terriglobia bacterium]|nr:YwiC-like family protein [Terriglobia bacterium]
MGAVSASRSEVQPQRRQALVWPREHGAWGIVLVALFTGAGAGLSSAQNLPPLFWLTLAVVAAFCLRTPIENSLPASPFRPRTAAEWRSVMTASAAYAVCGGFAVWMLARAGVLNLFWKPGLAAAGLFALQAVIKRAGRSYRAPGEVVGAFGLALTAVGGWAVATGQINSQAVALWILNGLFATIQIIYVQFRIRAARGGSFPKASTRRRLLIGEMFVFLVLVAGASAGVMPALALVAFLPILVDVVNWSLRATSQPLEIHRLGRSQLAHSILFGLLLITAFRLPFP